MSGATAAPRGGWFDDFAAGQRFVTKGVTVTESMIIDFSLRYDPQPFHIDVEAGKRSNFGGLIASGFLTMALGFRLVFDTGLFGDASMGSPGFDELRWLKPVRPGDTLHSEVEVVETLPSRSKPDRGIARLFLSIRNQRGEEVLTCRTMQLLRRRPA